MPILPDVFLVRGRFRIGPLLHIPRNMIVVRRGDELTVIHAVRLRPQGEAKLRELGKVRHVVKLGHFHGVDDPYYVERYGATYWALPGVPNTGAAMVDRHLIVGRPLPIPDATLFAFRDTAHPEAALLLPVEGGLLITCDAVQHWEGLEGASLLARPILRAMGFGRPVDVGGPWLRAMTRKEGPSLRADFERLVELRFDHLVGAHGAPKIGGARARLRAALRRRFEGRGARVG